MAMNKEELIKTCLARNGHPIVQVNVTPEQLEICYKLALKKFIDYHNDGYNEGFLFYDVSEQMAKNQEVDIPLGVDTIYNILSQSMSGSSNIYNNLSMQFTMSEMLRPDKLGGMGLGGYCMSMSYLNMADNLLNWSKNFTFNRYERKLRFQTKLTAGSSIAIACAFNIDFIKNNYAYEAPWLESYLTALIGEQWGMNLKKWGNVAITGGQTIDASGILATAQENKKDLERELVDSYSQDSIQVIVG